MHLFEIGETVKKGLHLQFGPYPYLDTPHGCSHRLLLHKEVSDCAERNNNGPYRPMVGFADMELGKELLVLHTPRRRGRKHSSLVRVRVAGGVGGVARLLANCYTEAVGKNEEVGRQYFPFPSAGVYAFCSEEHKAQLRLGLEFLDVLMLLQPGAGFRIHRTGNLKDQHGVKAPSQLSVRWTGYTLSSKGYDDRIPVLNLVADVPALAAE